MLNSSSLNNFLKNFQTVSLEEMTGVALLNRIDTKYVVNVNVLPELLTELQDNYNILEIEGKRHARYNTVYYDTPENDMLYSHLRGKLNRFKVRRRTYTDSGLSFLEVKFKNNKNRTQKWRTADVYDCTENKILNNTFLKQYTPYEPHTLRPALKNNFTRITLVDKAFTMRLTIDLKIDFNGKDNAEQTVPMLAIIETKTDKSNTSANPAAILRKYKIKPSGFSKYCVGRSLVSEYHQKQGNIKPKLLKLNRIANATIYTS